MKLFTTHASTEIPPVAKTGFEAQYNLSERFFASVKTTGGDLCKCTVRYDHSRQKWLFGESGKNDVLEYYKEVQLEQLHEWLGKNPHIGHLDGQTLVAMSIQWMKKTS